MVMRMRTSGFWTDRSNASAATSDHDDLALGCSCVVLSFWLQLVLHLAMDHIRQLEGQSVFQRWVGAVGAHDCCRRVVGELF